jgi:hypothetical protein
MATGSKGPDERQASQPGGARLSRQQALIESVHRSPRQLAQRASIARLAGHGVVQGFFNAKRYGHAAARWAEAAERAQQFDEQLDELQIKENGKASALKTNLDFKANHAATTLAGEAAEPGMWRVDSTEPPSVIGPGAKAGADLFRFDLSKRKSSGYKITGSSLHGEVKTIDGDSSQAKGNANSAIADAHRKKAPSVTLLSAFSPEAKQSFNRENQHFSPTPRPGYPSITVDHHTPGGTFNKSYPLTVSTNEKPRKKKSPFGQKKRTRTNDQAKTRPLALPLLYGSSESDDDRPSDPRVRLSYEGAEGLDDETSSFGPSVKLKPTRKSESKTTKKESKKEPKEPKKESKESKKGSKKGSKQEEKPLVDLSGEGEEST